MVFKDSLNCIFRRAVWPQQLKRPKLPTPTHTQTLLPHSPAATVVTPSSGLVRLKRTMADYVPMFASRKNPKRSHLCRHFSCLGFGASAFLLAPPSGPSSICHGQVGGPMQFLSFFVPLSERLGFGSSTGFFLPLRFLLQFLLHVWRRPVWFFAGGLRFCPCSFCAGDGGVSGPRDLTLAARGPIGREGRRTTNRWCRSQAPLAGAPTPASCTLEHFRGCECGAQGTRGVHSRPTLF